MRQEPSKKGESSNPNQQGVTYSQCLLFNYMLIDTMFLDVLWESRNPDSCEMYSVVTIYYFI